MPPFETFRDSESHAATVAHELTHWTRHPSRLNRDFGRKKWGAEGYAFEELVAELERRDLLAVHPASQSLEIPNPHDDHLRRAEVARDAAASALASIFPR